MSNRLDWKVADRALENLDETIERMRQDAKRRPSWAMTELEEFRTYRKPEPKFNWHILTGLALVVGVALVTVTSITAALMNLFPPETLRLVLGWAFWAGVTVAGSAAVVEALAAMEEK